MTAADDPVLLPQARLDAFGARVLSNITTPAEREKVLVLAEESAGIGIWDVDLRTGMARGTAQFFRILGLEPTTEPVPMDVLRARRHPDDRDRVVDGFRNAVASGAETFETEYRIIRPDGAIRWVFGRGRVVRGGDRTPLRYSGVDIDITDRKQAEAALAESEARLALAQEAAGIGIWDWNIASGTLRWSAQQCRLHGVDLTSEPLNYAMWQAALHPEDRDRADTTIMEAVANNAAYEDEYRVILPDGQIRWLNSKGRVILDFSGRPKRMLGVAYDETVRRNAVDALAQLNAELEGRVEQRTAELVQLQKLETLGHLTGGIAHDFNNLLAVLLGNLRLLRKRSERDESDMHLIDVAIQAAERGADLTQRMLAFARRQELSSAPINVPQLIRTMSDLLSRSLGPTVRLTLQLPDSLPPARADGGQLEMAVLNLAVNARDAMPLGGVLAISARLVTLKAQEQAGLRGGSYIVMEFTDTGEGMDASTLARAMEPFFTTKGVGKGTGLGLAMVHGFAAQSGGLLQLTSQLQGGTTAAVWLPVAIDNIVEKTSAVCPCELPRPTVPSLSVLAVDDDALVLMGTEAMLEDLRHSVTGVHSAEEALDKLRAGAKFDLVISDQGMPRVTGLELAALIRKQWPELPFLLMTGYAELPKGTDPGLPRLSKPFTQEALAAAIMRVISARQDETDGLPIKPRQA